MLSDRVTLYRGLLRELRLSLKAPRKVNKHVVAPFRSIAEKLDDSNPRARQDYDNAINFIRAQREHKRLLERYNPLFDLTAQERIKATANRVGFNMPKIHNEQ
ncbi:hypothetical protein JR316_0004546 [Psilocybe cubensis]|uniref:Uncharacterized protein n=2 Tax=Psilocybe cubensis TaxID=181762 RepID=A0ACB8H3M6_PSICU|nr:hypothetical protein JR316_0004546 [Psilocybe cubensis]KAH9482446.1 hypothetical protein JR316_0004546 [Psilocybe cubensis]